MGLEALHVQGIPVSVLKKYPRWTELPRKRVDTLYHDLAGNAFTGSAWGAHLLGILAYLPPALHEACEAKHTRDDFNVDANSLIIKA